MADESKEHLSLVAHRSSGAGMDAPPPYDASATHPQPAQTSAPYPKQVGMAPAVAPVPSDGLGDDVRHSSKNLQYLRYIPVMPIWFAVILFCVNCVIPGLGCWLAIPFICVCTHTAVQEDGRGKFVCINFGLGIASLILAGIGIGYWIAIAWSGATVMNSKMYYQRPIAEKDITTIQVNPVTGERV